MHAVLKTTVVSAVLAVSGLAYAQKGETVRIAFMDPLSGPFANVGQNLLKSWQFAASRYSGKLPAGVNFEVVGFDNKGSPQESLNTVRAAIDQGFRYIVQGNGSGAAAAIMDAVAKHNERNPGNEVVYLNYAAVDPALTNEKCNFWHFRLYPDTAMHMEALTAFMKGQPNVKKVYLINQNYSHGQQVASYFKAAIARVRPDIAIVGEDLTPIGQVKDFAPYAAKIKQAGADAIVTGNWGQDLTLFAKAMNEAGLKVPMYTYYAESTGTPTVLAAGGDSEVYVITLGHSNPDGETGQMKAQFKKKFNDDFYMYSSANGIQLLDAAMAKTQSTNPVKVARALEGLSIKGSTGDVVMRASDHQLQQSMYITKWLKNDKEHPYSVENTGFGFVPVKKIESSVLNMPTTCQMKRPPAG